VTNSQNDHHNLSNFIGAGSVVTKDIPEDVLAVGNPCRVIRAIEK
jgi:acetyltransferase-like isoleucine patch superfamily enzyme